LKRELCGDWGGGNRKKKKKDQGLLNFKEERAKRRRKKRWRMIMLQILEASVRKVVILPRTRENGVTNRRKT